MIRRDKRALNRVLVTSRKHDAIPLQKKNKTQVVDQDHDSGLIVHSGGGPQRVLPLSVIAFIEVYNIEIKYLQYTMAN